MIATLITEFTLLAQTLLAVVGFGGMMIAPGYLALRFTGLPVFKVGPGFNRVLWSITLSAPIATMLAVLAKPTIGNQGTAALFGALDLLAIFTCAHSPRPLWIRFPAVLLILGGVLAIFLLLAGLPIFTGQHLWEPTASADWSVRVPLVAAESRDNGVMTNPFYAVNGQLFPLRYYYYWYALCGVLGGSLGLPARALMSAGTIWAGWLLLATLFLLLQTVFRPEESPSPPKYTQLCLGACLAMPVLGFDILQTVYAFIRYHALWPEPEWWRTPSAETPSFQTMLLYAPHHTFGICACLTGFMLIVETAVEPAHRDETISTLGFTSILIGICLAAVIGTSTYVAVCFSVVLVIILIERGASKDLRTFGVLGIAAFIALITSSGFLSAMLTHTGNAPSHKGILTIALRSWSAVGLWTYEHQVANRFPVVVRLAVRLFLYITLQISEAGFMLLVFLRQAEKDAASGTRLSIRSRQQWVLTAGFALSALLLSSASVIGSNDLGFHAAFVLRLIGVLWAAPLFALLTTDSNFRRGFVQSTKGQVALLFIAIGLLSQVWQTVMQRFGLPISQHTYVIPGPFPSPPNLGERYLAAFNVNQAVDKSLPSSSRLLTNPWSVQRSMGLLYVNRQTIAPEPGCMVAFGGDAQSCKAALPSFALLFEEPAPSARQQGPSAWTSNTKASVALFERVCREQHASAILVSSDDPVWRDALSWVWAQPTLYRSEFERLLRCPSDSVLATRFELSIVSN